jgi:hypothetical protein
MKRIVAVFITAVLMTLGFVATQASATTGTSHAVIMSVRATPSVMASSGGELGTPTSMQFVVGETYVHTVPPVETWSATVSGVGGANPTLAGRQIKFTLADGVRTIATLWGQVGDSVPSVPNASICSFTVSLSGTATVFAPYSPSQTCIGGSGTLTLTQSEAQSPELSVTATYTGAQGWAPSCSSRINPLSFVGPASYAAVAALNVPCESQPGSPRTTAPQQCRSTPCSTDTTLGSGPWGLVPWSSSYDQPSLAAVTATVTGPVGLAPTLRKRQVTFIVSDNGPQGSDVWSYSGLVSDSNVAECTFVTTPIEGDSFLTSPCGVGFAQVGYPDYGNVSIQAVYSGARAWLPSASARTQFGPISSLSNCPRAC